MRTLNNNIKAFLELVRAGLWEKEACLLSFGEVDYEVVMRLAEEQSVVGLVTSGLEHVTDVKIPQEVLLQFIGSTLQIEQRNKGMNNFVADLIEKLRKEDVYAILVKGQGIAQCYERPFWRASGDVDLFLSNNNFKKAAFYLSPLASSKTEEFSYVKHLALTINQWEVELHGNLRGDLWRCLDKTIDEAQRDVFEGGSVRSWMNGKTQVFLPGVNEDIFFVFTHILQHYFKEGIGLRQICDWCRLLWTYRESIDYKKLNYRLKKAGVISEWKVFASLAVDWLGMPADAMPLCSDSKCIRIKTVRVLEYIIETGNFGQNIDFSFKQTSSSLKRKLLRFGQITEGSLRQFSIFPKDSVKVWFFEMLSGLRALAIRESNK